MPVDDAYTKSLLHFDGADASTTFTDESGKTWTARGNAQLDTAAKKFGTASGLFDGAGDYIDTPDHADFSLGTSDFTFDFWIKRNGTGSDQYIFGQINSSGTISTLSIGVAFLTNNTLEIDIGYGSNVRYVTTATAITDTASFHHIAVSRWGNYLICAIDGTFDANTADMTGITVNNSAVKFSIGRCGEYADQYVNAQIDEFRFSAGIARWTDDFTPPTVAYGAIALTVDNMTLAQVLDNISLTQHHVLVPQDITLAQILDSVALTQHHVITVQDITLAQVLDSPSLTQHNILAIQDITLAQVLDNVAITTQAMILFVQDITLPMNLENVTMSFSWSGTPYQTVARRYTMSDLVPEDPFEIYQGAQRTFTWTLTDNNDVAFDLTGYTAKLEIRTNPGGNLISTLTSSPAAGLTINAAAGQITPLWTGTQTAAFNFDKAHYDCFLLNSLGVPTCIAYGEITLTKRVTQ
jgi:hypothetical protein